MNKRDFSFSELNIVELLVGRFFINWPIIAQSKQLKFNGNKLWGCLHLLIDLFSAIDPRSQSTESATNLVQSLVNLKIYALLAGSLMISVPVQVIY